jgi:hypothetical protein
MEGLCSIDLRVYAARSINIRMYVCTIVRTRDKDLPFSLKGSFLGPMTEGHPQQNLGKADAPPRRNLRRIERHFVDSEMTFFALVHSNKHNRVITVIIFASLMHMLLHRREILNIRTRLLVVHTF